MDWQHLAAGWAITLAVPFTFIVLPMLVGKLLQRYRRSCPRADQ